MAHAADHGGRQGGLSRTWPPAVITAVLALVLTACGTSVGTSDADAGLPAPLAAAGGLAAAVLLAAVIALVALSVPGETAVPLFILLTLGGSQLLQRTATTLDSVTGGANGMAAPPLDLVSSYYLVLVVVAVAVALTHRLIVRGRRGAFQLAVLVNPARAEHLGVNLRSTQTVAFMASAAVSAAAGVLFAPAAGLVTPATLGLALSTSVLTWLAVGGRGSLIGPFLGAVVLTVGAQAFGGTGRAGTCSRSPPCSC